MTKPVLVTSAAGGRQGKTGRHVSEMLLARGLPVRAFVRTIDDRSNHLRALGAEIFQGDFLDIRSVQLAVEGDLSGRRIPERAGPDCEFETPDKPNLTRLPDFPASRNRAPKQLKQDNDQDQCQTKNQSPPTTRT